MVSLENYLSADVPEIVGRSLFMKYDSNSDGSLSREEMQVMLTQDLSLTENQAESFFNFIDNDASGSITFEEFWESVTSGHLMKLIGDRSRFHLVEIAMKKFKQLDADHSGLLDKTELEQLIVSLGLDLNDKSRRAVMRLDVDGDEKVSFNEFMKWLNWIELSPNEASA